MTMTDPTPMGRLTRLATAAAIAVVTAATGAIAPAHALTPTAPATPPAKVTVRGFWTSARVAAARPRDVTYRDGVATITTRTNTTAPTIVAPRLGATTRTELATRWTSGGSVARTTGKVFFSMGPDLFSCSGSVIVDGATGRSLVLTAAHCAYDSYLGFARNWTFIPAYDAAPADPLTSGDFCSQTKFGCWGATTLVVPRAFANEPDWLLASQHDYAIAMVALGGKTRTQELDQVVGANKISCLPSPNGVRVWSFGYPSMSPFNGIRLTFSRGKLSRDPDTGYRTYTMPSQMTHGSSGGPWLLSAGPGQGTIISVVSYGISGIPVFHGPMLTSETQAMTATALNSRGFVLY